MSDSSDSMFHNAYRTAGLVLAHARTPQASPRAAYFALLLRIPSMFALAQVGKAHTRRPAKIIRAQVISFSKNYFREYRPKLYYTYYHPCTTYSNRYSQPRWSDQREVANSKGCGAYGLAAELARCNGATRGRMLVLVGSHAGLSGHKLCRLG